MFPSYFAQTGHPKFALCQIATIHIETHLTHCVESCCHPAEDNSHQENWKVIKEFCMVMVMSMVNVMVTIIVMLARLVLVILKMRNSY